MIFGSVCSGIEAASCAWGPLGWTARWFSEIAPFPSKLLSHRFPETPNHGSLVGLAARLAGTDRHIDLLVGGTPCQSFSVAGLRGGLADERGNLALEFARLAQALRPRWVLWENVPGVLSSNGGRDFGAIIGALVELGYGVAYRVLDARHFGVPQRRRRVFLVGSLAGWAAAAAVLFEPESLRWNSSESRATGQEVAGTLGGGSGKRGWAPDTDRMTFVPELAPTLTKHNGQRNDVTSDTFIATAEGSREVCLTRSNVRSNTQNNQSPLVVMSSGQSNASISINESPTLTCLHEAPIAAGLLAPTLDRSLGDKWGSNQWVNQWSEILQAQAAAGWRVRRLTPVECERLQGFPDGWTDIPGGSDSGRYAALGNSMAVPVMRWIGERIDLVDALVKPTTALEAA